MIVRHDTDQQRVAPFSRVARRERRNGLVVENERREEVLVGRGLLETAVAARVRPRDDALGPDVEARGQLRVAHERADVVHVRVPLRFRQRRDAAGPLNRAHRSRGYPQRHARPALQRLRGGERRQVVGVAALDGRPLGSGLQPRAVPEVGAERRRVQPQRDGPLRRAAQPQRQVGRERVVFGVSALGAEQHDVVRPDLLQKRLRAAVRVGLHERRVAG
mmetsp:Transcript_8298/g.25961  ORF Transcript_8298/g.25961 Transcript_8298/m.25961 type:complete len:219 (-) Transcript_8298:385-1041(-)